MDTIQEGENECMFFIILQIVSSISGVEEIAGIWWFNFVGASAVSFLILNSIYLYSKAQNPTAVIHEKLGVLGIIDSD